MPVPLKDILEKLSREVGFSLEFKNRDVEEAWRRAVGETICKNAIPYSLRRGILWVICTGPHWMAELQMLKETIKERMNSQLGPGRIKDIRFKVGQIPERDKPQDQPEVEITPEEAQRILSPLEDKPLRETALRILKAIKRHHRAERS